MCCAVVLGSVDYGEQTGFLSCTADELHWWMKHKGRGTILPIDKRLDYSEPHKHESADMFFSGSELHLRWPKGSKLTDAITGQVVTAIRRLAASASAPASSQAVQATAASDPAKALAKPHFSDIVMINEQ